MATSKTSGYSRRTFLKAAAAFTGTSVFGGMSFKSFAATTALAPAGRCFVVLYFAGGWDQLLSLDPRDPAIFTPERISDTKILPAYSTYGDPLINNAAPLIRPAGSNITFGPSIGNLAKHYDKMAIVRGVNMNTLSHSAGYRYFLTGKEPNGDAARGSSLATEIVGQLAPTVPIPSLAYQIESYNERFGGAANALRVSSSNDLLLTLTKPTGLDSEIEKMLIDVQGKPVTCEADLFDTRGLVTSYRASQSQMRAIADAALDRAFDFQEKKGANPEMATLRTAYGIPSTGSYEALPGARAATVAVALKKGISQCVSMQLVGGLDDHNGPLRTHSETQRGAWNAVSALVDDLSDPVASPHPAGGSMMDHTTILIFSEFARTPLINERGGRDHHLASSCMLLGKGIKKNYVLGATGDIAMIPARVNHATGELDPSGTNIFPEHVIASVLHSAGLDYSDTRAEPILPLLEL